MVPRRRRFFSSAVGMNMGSSSREHVAAEAAVLAIGAAFAVRGRARQAFVLDGGVELAQDLLYVGTHGARYGNLQGFLHRGEVDEGAGHGATEGVLGEHGVSGELVLVVKPDPRGHLVLDGDDLVGGEDDHIDLAPQTQALRVQVNPEPALALLYPVGPEGPAGLLRRCRLVLLLAEVHLGRYRTLQRQGVAVIRYARAVDVLPYVRHGQLKRAQR